MPFQRYQLAVDWDNDGTFGEAEDDISADVLSLDAKRGRDYASQLTGRSVAGKLTAVLDNESQKYSSFNTGSPITGKVLPGRKVALRAGPYGDFGGLDNVVNVPDASDLQNVFDGGTTIEVRLHPRSDGENNLAYIISKVNWILRLQNESNGFCIARFLYLWSGNDYGVSTPSANVPINKTSHLAVTYNADTPGNSALIHLNGVLQSPGAENTPTGTRNSDIGIDLLIGDNPASNRALDSLVDEIRIWSDERTTQEIQENMWREMKGDEQGLIALWKFNEGKGTTVGDSSLNGLSHNGTATGMTWSYFDIWSGFLKTILPTPSRRGTSTAKLEAIGPLGYLNENKVQVAMSTSKGTGAAIGDILDAAGWPAGDRDIDTGQTTMTRFFMARTNVMEALRIVERSEGGFIKELANGRIAFEDRHKRLKAPHLTSQATFSDVVGATLGYSNIKQSDPLPGIFNLFEITFPTFTVGSLATLWTLSESGASSPLISPGETRTFVAMYPTPSAPTADAGVDAWTTPVENTDYDANTASDGSGTDVSSDLAVAVVKGANTMEIAITNNGSVAAYVTLLQARGTPVSQNDPIRIFAEDATSKTAYGERIFTAGKNFVPDSAEARDWADFNLSIFKDSIPILSKRVDANRDQAHLDEVLTRDISDRITVVANTFASGLGLNEDFFIEAIRHRIDAQLKTHDVTWELSPASGYSNFWVLGTSALDTGTVLAY